MLTADDESVVTTASPPVCCRLELLEEGEKVRARNIVSGCLVFQRTMGRLKQKSITLVQVGLTAGEQGMMLLTKFKSCRQPFLQVYLTSVTSHNR